MPSKRRQFLWTMSMAGIGFAGCSSLTPTERDDDRRTTPTSQENVHYKPTTPEDNEHASTPTEEPEYVVQTPVIIAIRNHRSTPQSVKLTLEIEPSSGGRREVRNDTYEVSAEDSLRIGQFSESGHYHLSVETANQRDEKSTYVGARELADCNNIFIHVLVDESTVTLESWQTKADCPPITATPESNQSSDGK